MLQPGGAGHVARCLVCRGHAYTCADDVYLSQAVPEDAAVGVPTNTHIVWSEGKDGNTWLSAYDQGYRLYDQTMTEVSTTLESAPGEWMKWLVPEDDLAPRTAYYLQDVDGNVSSFTTGDGPDIDAPVGGDLIAVQVSDDGGYYGTWRVSFETVEPADPGPFWFEAEVTWGAGASAELHRFDNWYTLYDTGCWPNATFADEWEMCVRARHVDGSGNVAPWSDDIGVSWDGSPVDWCGSNAGGVDTGTGADPEGETDTGLSPEDTGLGEDEPDSEGESGPSEEEPGSVDDGADETLRSEGADVRGGGCGGGCSVGGLPPVAALPLFAIAILARRRPGER